MANKILLVVFLLLVPLGSYGVAHMVRQDYDRGWSAYLAKEYGDKAKEMNERVPFANFCAEQSRLGAAIEECATYKTAGFLQVTAAAAAAGGLLLFALIGAAGYLARANRNTLLYVFRPGLYLTISAAIALVIVHAALAMGAIYLIQTHVIIFWFTIIFVFIGLGAAVGCVAIVRGTISIFRHEVLRVFGKKLSPEEQPELFATVGDLAGKIGVAPPDHIVVGFDLSFFVTEGKIECHDRRLWGRTLFLSLPYCRILSRAELLGILGHELGHFKGLDTRFSKKFSPIYRVATECLARLEGEMTGSRAIALFPAYFSLAHFLESFALADNQLNRERELAADRVGADLFGAASCATALIKVHAFDEFWDGFRQGVREAVATERVFANGGVHFAEAANERWQSAFYGLEERHTPHPLNSHPTLQIRLKALDCSAAELIERGAVALPDAPAVELIANYEKIEEELTAIKQKSMMKPREVPTEKTCPACHRKNPLKAELCECGFNFLRMPVG